MKLNNICALVVVSFLGSFFSVPSHAFEFGENPDDYVQYESNPYSSSTTEANLSAKDGESESADPLIRQFQSDAKESFEKMIANLVIPTVNIPDYFDGEASSLSNGLIAIALLPVLSKSTNAGAFPMATADSIAVTDPKTKVRRRATDPYAEMKDFFSIKISAVSGVLHLKTMSGQDLGTGHELSFRQNKDRTVDYILDGVRSHFDGISLLADADQLTHVYWNTIAGERSSDYRGNFMLLPDVTPIGQVCVKVINILNVERYVADTIQGEMLKAGAVALKANVVAIRSKAYKSMKLSRAAHRNFDLVAGSQDQLYMGAVKESELANQVTQETFGEVLLHKGNLIDIMYSANNGGYIKDVRDYNPKSKMVPWLVGGQDILVDEIRAIRGTGTRYRGFNATNFLAAIHRVGKVFPDKMVIGFVPIAFNSSKRTTGIRVFGDSTSVDITGSDYEKFASDPEVKLGKPFMEKGRLEGDVVYAKEYGWGHGVGLCQGCAILRAKLLHQDYKTILKAYFKDTTVEKINLEQLPSAESI